MGLKKIMLSVCLFACQTNIMIYYGGIDIGDKLLLIDFSGYAI
jgi:hypothetical protein